MYSTKCYTIDWLQGHAVRVYKNKAFSRWAAKEGLTDEALWAAGLQCQGIERGRKNWRVNRGK